MDEQFAALDIEATGMDPARHEVIEVAVIGLPDPHSGEAVTAYVASRSLNLTEDVVRSWCRERLAAYKVPRHVIFRESLPKSTVGKVLRRALRDGAVP